MSKQLFGRERELGAVEARVRAAVGREGGVLLIEGPAGMGKTAVLDAARERAARAEMSVLSARGGVLERAFPFGVVRQLFEPAVLSRCGPARARLFSDAAGLAAPVFGLEPASRGRPPPNPEGAALLGLYWLMVALADDAPLLLTVDDLHWADAPSVAWLAFAARRLAGLPVAVIAAMRAGEAADRPAPDPIAEVDAEVLRLASLDEAAIAAVMRDAAGAEPEAAFCAACRTVTGGNAFLVREVARSVRAGAFAPTAEHAAEVEAVRSSGLMRFVEARLRALPPAAAALACAAATLEAGAELRHAAALAELQLDRAVDCRDLLRDRDILSGGGSLVFAHPIVRGVVYDAMPHGQRARAHARAARLLHREGAPAERVASHLLRTEPAAQSWVVAVLRDAARDALARGAAASAVELLGRALREGVASRRAELLHELGLAETRLRDGAAAGHLEEARRLIADPRARAEIALALAQLLLTTGAVERAFPLLEDAIAEAERVDADLALRLEGILGSTARLSVGWAERVAARGQRFSDDLDGATPGERAVLAWRAGDHAMRATSAARAEALAERALGGGLLAHESPDSPVFYFACMALAFSGRHAAARAHIDAARADARARGFALGFANASTWRAMIAYREGALAEAEADARAALDVAHRHGEMIARPLALSYLIMTLVEQDRSEEALAVLEAEGYAGPIADAPVLDLLAYARGRLRLDLHQPRLALEDLETAMRIERAVDVPSPELAPSRAAAADAHAALGNHVTALQLADQELAVARRFGGPWALGVALRTRAVLGPPTTRIELLQEAVRVLESSEARLQHAHALCGLGIAVRQRGAPKAARDPLRQALDRATHCGAHALVTRCRHELLATGARPRRTTITGRDALTPAELRVADLAAGSMTNRQIAQALFVTPKTIETQLSSAYHKLGVTSRHELRDALAPPPR